jgi:primosomal protein N'
VPLTLHLKFHKLVCHYCGTQYDVPTHCPQCEQADLRDIGAGTEKIEAAVEACFPTAKVARMDLDTTRSRSAYERIIREFQTGRSNLLVGTQMVTKGLDFGGVSVVGIVNADQLLNACDFRAHERAFQMLSQVAGRAGRRGSRGRVVLQTRKPDLPVVAQIVAGDYPAMYKKEMADRRTFRYPPEVRLIMISFKHRDERTVAVCARLFADLLQPHFGDDLFGPMKPVVSYVQLQHIRRIMLKVSPTLSPTSVRTTLWAARDRVLAHSACRNVTIYFDVDPM